MPVSVEHGPDVAGELAAEQVPAGDVDGRPGCRPARATADHATSWRVASARTQQSTSMISVGRLGDRDERVGREQPVAGPVPADERLGADQRTRTGVETRAGTAAASPPPSGSAQRRGEGGLDVFALDHLPLQVGVEDLDRRAVVLLGAVHRGVGAGQQPERLLGSVEGQGDADRGADVDLAARRSRWAGRSVSMMRRARSVASATPATPSATTTNSSPPRRATKSPLAEPDASCGWRPGAGPRRRPRGRGCR